MKNYYVIAAACMAATSCASFGMMLGDFLVFASNGSKKAKAEMVERLQNHPNIGFFLKESDLDRLVSHLALDTHAWADEHLSDLGSCIAAVKLNTNPSSKFCEEFPKTREEYSRNLERAKFALQVSGIEFDEKIRGEAIEFLSIARDSFDASKEGIAKKAKSAAAAAEANRYLSGEDLSSWLG